MSRASREAVSFLQRLASCTRGSKALPIRKARANAGVAATILAVVSIGMVFPTAVRAGDEKPPKSRDLIELVREYLDADEDRRREMRAEADAKYAPLEDGRTLDKLRAKIIEVTMKTGPRLKTTGTNYFYSEKDKRGKYISKGKKSRTLFIGLHGGGVGSGDAGSMASGMGGGGWFWIFPEVLEKTERGWTDSDTDKFVLELVDAAKRTIGTDPDRVYVTGHSMGGYGSWTLGAHHADVFAGAAAYAGGPTPIFAGDGTTTVVDIVEGVLPNFYNSRLLFFQSTDDPRVTPEANQAANKFLLELKQKHPKGFDFRYYEVDDRQHAPPAEGYLKTQQWVAEHERVARPRKILWQPVLDWKKQFHWIYWQKPEYGAILQVEAPEAEPNTIDIRVLDGSKNLEGISILLGEPIVDLEKEVVIRVDGEEKFRGIVERTLSTLLLTLPRNDPKLLFDARVDLDKI